MGICLKYFDIIPYILNRLLNGNSNLALELFCLGLIIILVGFAAKGVIDSILNERYNTNKPIPIFTDKPVKNISNKYEQLKNNIHEADIAIYQLLDQNFRGSMIDKTITLKEQISIFKQNFESFENNFINNLNVSNIYEMRELIIILNKQSKKLAYIREFIFSNLFLMLPKKKLDYNFSI